MTIREIVLACSFRLEGGGGGRVFSHYDASCVKLFMHKLCISGVNCWNAL